MLVLRVAVVAALAGWGACEVRWGVHRQTDRHTNPTVLVVWQHIPTATDTPPRATGELAVWCGSAETKGAEGVGAEGVVGAGVEVEVGVDGAETRMGGLARLSPLSNATRALPASALHTATFATLGTGGEAAVNWQGPLVCTVVGANDEVVVDRAVVPPAHDHHAALGLSLDRTTGLLHLLSQGEGTEQSVEVAPVVVLGEAPQQQDDGDGELVGERRVLRVAGAHEADYQQGAWVCDVGGLQSDGGESAVGISETIRAVSARTDVVGWYVRASTAGCGDGCCQALASALAGQTALDHHRHRHWLVEIDSTACVAQLALVADVVVWGVEGGACDLEDFREREAAVVAAYPVPVWQKVGAGACGKEFRNMTQCALHAMLSGMGGAVLVGANPAPVVLFQVVSLFSVVAPTLRTPGAHPYPMATLSPPPTSAHHAAFVGRAWMVDHDAHSSVFVAAVNLNRVPVVGAELNLHAMRSAFGSGLFRYFPPKRIRERVDMYRGKVVLSLGRCEATVVEFVPDQLRDHLLRL